METIVHWNAGMSSACVCWAARKMIRLPCLCVHRNMNVITPPYPISRVVVCTCDRGIAGVYMWPSFCVRRWPRLCVHVTVGSLVFTCDRRFACAGDRKARKRSLCVHVTWICVRGWPLDLWHLGISWVYKATRYVRHKKTFADGEEDEYEAR